MKTIEEVKIAIESRIGNFNLIKYSDCVNLLFTINQNGLNVGSVYKSFNSKFEKIFKIRYSI